MTEPRLLEEREVSDVVSFPQQPTRPQAQPKSVAQIYQAIANVLAARLQCLLLVIAMIALSGSAVLFPLTERLYGAAGFDLLALVGLVILGPRQ
jgi:hypothetical protein